MSELKRWMYEEEKLRDRVKELDREILRLANRERRLVERVERLEIELAEAQRALDSHELGERGFP
jgi:hypothetical protein